MTEDKANNKRTFRLSDEYYNDKLQLIVNHHKKETKGRKSLAIKFLIDKEVNEITKNCGLKK